MSVRVENRKRVWRYRYEGRHKEKNRERQIQTERQAQRDLQTDIQAVGENLFVWLVGFVTSS